MNTNIDVTDEIKGEITLVKDDIKEAVQNAFMLQRELELLETALNCEHDFQTIGQNLVFETKQCTKCKYEIDI